MGIGNVIVRLAHSAPSAHELDGEYSRRSSAPRLGSLGVVKLYIFTARTATRGTFSYRVLPWTAGDHCMQQKHTIYVYLKFHTIILLYLWGRISLDHRSSVAEI